MSARAICPKCGWTGEYASRNRAEAMAARHVCRHRPTVRRATRRYGCQRCGLEAVYDNASAAEARRWFLRHSCRKRELAMLRSVQAQQRLALVDRTPKPCTHKVAAHQHGTRACYVLDACRCMPCSKANAAAEQERERLKAYGRYHKYVNAEHVREHLAELKAYGIGLKQVSRLSGVSNGSLTKIWFGLYATTGTGKSGGRNGVGELLRGPSRRVLRSTAEAIFAIEAIPANLATHQPDHERTPAARLQLQALVALGWSMSKLGQRIGIQGSNMAPVIQGDRQLARITCDRILALYSELSMTLPPQAAHRDKISVTRAKHYAAQRGWLLPLELEGGDEVVDPVNEDDYVDEVAVQRRMAGDRGVRLTKAEAAELVQRWATSGRSLNECERVTGIKPDRHYRQRDQREAAVS